MNLPRPVAAQPGVVTSLPGAGGGHTEPCAYGCGDPECSQGRKCGGGHTADSETVRDVLVALQVTESCKCRGGDENCDNCLAAAGLAALKRLEAAANRTAAIREAVGSALLISTEGETKMPREDWLRIEGACLAAGIETPVVALTVPAEEKDDRAEMFVALAAAEAERDAAHAALRERAEHWEREAADGEAASESFRGVDTDAAVDLARAANRARSRAKELRDIVARAVLGGPE